MEGEGLKRGTANFCDLKQIFLSLRDERRVVADQIMEARKAEEDSL